MNQVSLHVLRQVLDLVAARKPTPTILDRLCQLVEESIPQGLASVMRLDPGRNKLRFENAPSAPPGVLEALGELTPGPLSGSCGAAVHTGQMAAVSDTATDARWQGLRPVAEEFGIQACWSVPIFVHAEDVAGSFAISRTAPGLPDAEQTMLLQLAAQLAGVAIRLEEADAALRQQRDMLQAVVECTEDPIFVKDREGRYQLANEAEARKRGCRPEDLIGKSDAESGGEVRGDAAVQASDQQVLTDERSVVTEETLTLGEDGELREYMIRKDPLRGPDGEVVGLVGIARDLTELRRVERAMQHSQKLESLGVLAGGIAHDFNNLLVSILGSASLLEETQMPPDRVRERIKSIRIASERARDLTQQLLQYAGKHNPKRERVELRRMLEEMPGLLSAAVPSDIDLQLELPAGLPSLTADPTQLRQVFLNLLHNAAEAFEGAAGRITIRALVERDSQPVGQDLCAGVPERRDWLRISVRDNAQGMGPETMARMFDPFFTTKLTGRGLGLAAVLGIIRSHGGHLQVDSRPGQGTEFRIWLPLDETDSGPDAVEGPEQARQKPGPGLRVLLAEDEPMVAETMRQILQLEGHEVVHVADGDRALEIFAAAQPAFDVVIADYTMPGSRGDELARQIRARDKRVAIVLSSGLSQREAVGRARDSVDAFLAKPFAAKDVRWTLAAAQQMRMLSEQPPAS